MHRFLFRRIIQSALGVGVTNGYLKGFIPSGALWQGQSKGFCVPVLNCYACPGSLFACPIGTLQHFVIIRAVPMYFIGLFVTFWVGLAMSYVAFEILRMEQPADWVAAGIGWFTGLILSIKWARKVWKKQSATSPRPDRLPEE